MNKNLRRPVQFALDVLVLKDVHRSGVSDPIVDVLPEIDHLPSLHGRSGRELPRFLSRELPLKISTAHSIPGDRRDQQLGHRATRQRVEGKDGNALHQSIGAGDIRRTTKARHGK